MWTSTQAEIMQPGQGYWYTLSNKPVFCRTIMWAFTSYQPVLIITMGIGAKQSRAQQGCGKNNELVAYCCRTEDIYKAAQRNLSKDWVHSSNMHQQLTHIDAFIYISTFSIRLIIEPGTGFCACHMSAPSNRNNCSLVQGFNICHTLARRFQVWVHLYSFYGDCMLSLLNQLDCRV